MVSGETTDISSFAKFGWYNWIKFWDETISFHGDREVLRRYLGPAIGVGPALTARILKRNGRIVHRSTYRHLTPEEEQSEDEKKERSEFDNQVKERLGNELTKEDIPEIDEEIITPTFEL